MLSVKLLTIALPLRSYQILSSIDLHPSQPPTGCADEAARWLHIHECT